jgi:quercetin dioxygenase-like cupin family protein
MTDTFHLTPSESVRVVRHDPDALEVEGTWGPGGSAPPKHFHPAQDERIEVLEGTLKTRVDGEERELRAGDVLDIPRGAVHQMWNEADVPARASWVTSPAGRTAQWFADLDALRRSGRVGGNGMPGPLAFGTYLTEYRDVFRLAGPQPVMTTLLKGLGALGRLKGYRPGAVEPGAAGPGAVEPGAVEPGAVRSGAS